ncbi:MAG TPA: bifunctional DedA family/phosphatase PAP2 family protein [Candidatus Dormibacteraeota bacterium]|nr:bifunctional DedA family/phosphatase PAP2 family protein [Candidatus Dormibacteraeota bacterium]
MNVLGVGLGVIGSFPEHILLLPGWIVVVLVFAFQALEASAFVGFVFPREITVILGGVAASQGIVPLWAVIVAAVSGAIIGDSIGYLIGRRWGTHLLYGTVGRLPVIRGELDKHLGSAQAYVRLRKGRAVFFGRFTAALRVLVPGLAGLSKVPYTSFLAYNVAGGLLWGSVFVILGYLAGASYARVEQVASRAGLGLLALVVLSLVLARVLRGLGQRSASLKTFGERLAAMPQLMWVQRRFPKQVEWVGRRLDVTTPRGFWLTFTLSGGALAAWALAGLTQDVVGHDETALFDPRAEQWIVAVRTAWLTGAMRSVTWLGSTAVIVPALVLTAAVLVMRGRDWRSAVLLATAVAGAVGLYNIVKVAVERPRPPSTLWIGEYSGAAFPSGHATQAVAFYGMLAIVLSTRGSPVVGVVVWMGAAVITLVVGASRLYLGAHWLTDILAGWALGAAWIAFVAAVTLLATGQGRRRATLPTTGFFRRSWAGGVPKRDRMVQFG